MIIVPLDANSAIVEEDGSLNRRSNTWNREVSRLGIIEGIGSPEGVQEGIVSQQYMDTTGAAGAITYVKRDSDVAGDTTKGWVITGGAGGFTPTIFQGLKSGTQSTTATATDLAGWTEDITSADISFNTTTGVVTFDTTGTYMISCHVVGEDIATGNNRCELNIQMQLDTGGGYANVAAALDSQYAVRNNTQNQGSAQFNSYALEATATDSVKLQVFDIGVPLGILSNRARITVLRVA